MQYTPKEFVTTIFLISLMGFLAFSVVQPQKLNPKPSKNSFSVSLIGFEGVQFREGAAR